MFLFPGEFDLAVCRDASESFVLDFALCYQIIELRDPFGDILGEMCEALQCIHLRGHDVVEQGPGRAEGGLWCN